MKKNLLKLKAIEVIMTFSKDEKSEFKKFLASPYFNTNGNIIKLYNLILKYEDKIKSDLITEKEIYLKIFNTDKFSYSTMRNMMSLLYQMCEDFLVINSTRTSEEYNFENQIKLLKEFSLRFLDKNYRLKYKKIDDSLDYHYLGYKYFKYKFDLNYSLAAFEWTRSHSENRRDALYEGSLLDICSIISSISEGISVNEYLRKQFNFVPKVSPAVSLFNNLNIKKFLTELKPLDDVMYNHISTEIKFIRLILNPDDFDNFFILKKEILKNIESYSNSEKYYHLSRLLTFVVNHFLGDSDKLGVEISEFRKIMLKYIKFGSHGVESLQMRIFMDIVDSFFNTDDLEYIEEFVNNHIDYVEIINRENAYNYALARIETKKDHFEKAIEYLGRLKLNEDILKFNSKLLIIQLHYELGNFESGLYAIDSIKHSFKNNKEFNSAVKKRYIRHCRLIESIYKIKINPEKYSQFEVDKLLLYVSKNYRNNKTWYQLKLEELNSYYIKKKSAASYG